MHSESSSSRALTPVQPLPMQILRLEGNGPATIASMPPVWQASCHPLARQLSHLHKRLRSLSAALLICHDTADPNAWARVHIQPTKPRLSVALDCSDLHCTLATTSGRSSAHWRWDVASIILDMVHTPATLCIKFAAEVISPQGLPCHNA